MAITIDPNTTFPYIARGKDKDNLSTVNFTRKQYEYLNRVFGERVGTAATTEAELRMNQGVRSVVCHVMGLVRD